MQHKLTKGWGHQQGSQDPLSAPSQALEEAPFINGCRPSLWLGLQDLCYLEGRCIWRDAGPRDSSRAVLGIHKTGSRVVVGTGALQNLGGFQKQYAIRDRLMAPS